MYKRLIKIGFLVVAIVLVASLGFIPAKVSTTGEGNLSLKSNIALAVNNPPDSEATNPTRYTGITTVTEELWGFLYQLENGDIVEVGDSTVPEFRSHIKTIRWNGLVDFSLWQEGGTFNATLLDDTVSFDFSNNIHVAIYPSPPCERIPEGGIEYDITLDKKPAKPTVTLNADWNNVTWKKIYGLDIEYDQARAYDSWYNDLYDNYPDNNLYGHDNGTGIFIITPTDVMTPDGQVSCIHREEYEVNSYIGTCASPTITTSDLGNGITYSNVSRSYLRIHRGQMTDALGDTAWIEDIILDEVAKTFTFVLPKTWLRNATYPVSQVCGVDPAYTEDMDSWLSTTSPNADSTWTDYDLFSNKGVPKGAVAEIIFAMQEAGVENEMGVRTDGSSLARYVNLHEAEGGGVQTCRMFVLCDASTGLIETWHSDASDADSYYVVGYWENVGFTERWDDETPGTGGSWQADEALVDSNATSLICHFLLRNQEDNTSNTMGVRDTSSAVERKVLVHEPEGGGESILDILTKADASYQVDLYTSDIANTVITNAGYFGSELDFVELFSEKSVGIATWAKVDVTADLDQDGRVTDWLLLHKALATEYYLGVRDGDDTTTNRYIKEHEAEDNGSSTGELTGFGISAKSNASGEVYLYYGASPILSDLMLMGYFKPVAGGEADIAVTPDTKNYGIVLPSQTHWSNSSEPTWPLVDGDAYFTITNNGDPCSITIVATNLVGTVTWTLGVPAENVARLTAFKEGDGSGDGVTLTTSPQAFISGLTTDIDWELKFETPTTFDYTDGSTKTSTITLAATLD